MGLRDKAKTGEGKDFPVPVNQAGKVLKKKGRKKQEPDRQKQAEKKRRRLEKALANSAAIISQLGKRKQNSKKEEQERPDEEEKALANSAAIISELGKKKQNKKEEQERLDEEAASKQKDELGRQKQAGKKLRRLEKLLANSAAIVSELERKKQRKEEEQEMLDGEVASIADAVALHVRIGEGSGESRRLVLNGHRRCDGCDPMLVPTFTWRCEKEDMYNLVIIVFLYIVIR